MAQLIPSLPIPLFFPSPRRMLAGRLLQPPLLNSGLENTPPPHSHAHPLVTAGDCPPHHPCPSSPPLECCTTSECLVPCPLTNLYLADSLATPAWVAHGAAYSSQLLTNACWQPVATATAQPMLSWRPDFEMLPAGRVLLLLLLLLLDRICRARGLP